MLHKDLPHQSTEHTHTHTHTNVTGSRLWHLPSPDPLCLAAFHGGLLHYGGPSDGPNGVELVRVHVPSHSRFTHQCPESSRVHYLFTGGENCNSETAHGHSAILM